MARAASSDQFQAHEYVVVDPQGFLDPVAGFSSVSLPTKDLSEAEYKEGQDTLPRKQRGVATVGGSTLQRGIAKRDTDFLNWLLLAIEGETDYRTDLEIWHFHGTDEKGFDGNPSRIIRLINVFPTSYTPGSDFDPNSEAISIESLSLSVEDVEVEVRSAAEV